MTNVIQFPKRHPQLLEVVEMPATLAEMSRLHERRRTAANEDELLSVFIAMAETGAKYRAEVAALNAAGMSDEDTERVLWAAIAAYCDLIRRIEGEDIENPALAGLLVVKARRSFGRRLAELIRFNPDQFGTA